MTNRQTSYLPFHPNQETRFPRSRVEHGMEWEFRPQGGGWAANLGLGGTLESWAPHETYNAQNGVGSSSGGVGVLWNVP